MKILLAEDNIINQEVAMAMLESLGHKVVIAGNGREAIQKTKDNKFDLIFMDCQMPEMDGYEATEELKHLMGKGKLQKCAIIALTANAMPSDRKKCISAGMDDYLTKPIEEKDLNNILVKWIGVSDEKVEKKKIDLTALDKLKELMGVKFPKLIATYIENAENAKLQILEAVKAGDAAKLAKVAHGLRPSAAQVGAASLAEELNSLEKLSSGGETQYVSNTAKSIAEAISSVNTELKKLIK